MCASVDGDEITEDTSENPVKQDENASVNPSDIPKEKVEDANVKPEDLGTDASANKDNHNKSIALATFEIDRYSVFKDNNHKWRNIYEKIDAIYLEKSKTLIDELLELCKNPNVLQKIRYDTKNNI